MKNIDELEALKLALIMHQDFNGAEMKDSIPALTTAIETLKRIDVEKMFIWLRHTCAAEKCSNTCPVYENGKCGVRKEAVNIVNYLTENSNDPKE